MCRRRYRINLHQQLIPSLEEEKKIRDLETVSELKLPFTS